MSEQKKHYAHRNLIRQGCTYAQHVEAMTAEALHSKSGIAAELAHRDLRIASLEQSLAAAQADAERYRGLRKYMVRATARVTQMLCIEAHGDALDSQVDALAMKGKPLSEADLAQGRGEAMIPKLPKENDYMDDWSYEFERANYYKARCAAGEQVLAAIKNRKDQGNASFVLTPDSWLAAKILEAIAESEKQL